MNRHHKFIINALMERERQILADDAVDQNPNEQDIKRYNAVREEFTAAIEWLNSVTKELHWSVGSKPEQGGTYWTVVDLGHALTVTFQIFNPGPTGCDLMSGWNIPLKVLAYAPSDIPEIPFLAKPQ